MDINQKHFDSLIFLERFEDLELEMELTELDIWKKVGEILSKLADPMQFKTATIFFSENSDYQKFIPVCSYPAQDIYSGELSFSSNDEIVFLRSHHEGICLPTKDGTMSWLNSHEQELFGQPNVFLYGGGIFKRDMLMIGFGVSESISVSNTHQKLLGIVAFRIIKTVSYLLSRIEAEKILAETGHYLGRIYGQIKSGISIFKKFGMTSNEDDSDEIRQIIVAAHNSVTSGLWKLDLTIRNHSYFYKRPRSASYNGIDKYKHHNVIDLISLLKEFLDIYEIELARDKKQLRFEFRTESANISAPEPPVKALFWNLIDNAIKFSYNDTYIDIVVDKKDDLYEIKISNLGIGFKVDEEQTIFLPFYKSAFKDADRAISGIGLGLSICKRIMTQWFPKGSLRIKSNPSSKDGLNRFDGDRYLTTLLLLLPETTNENST